MPTEREAVERERKAWDEAAYRLSCCGAGSQESNRLRDNLYPLPKTTRPRVVRDPHASVLHWRFREEKLEWCDGLDEDLWWNEPRAAVTPARVALWADLIARPTEDVEEEG